MMQSRKTVLDRNKRELVDTINTSNKVYTNEELSILVNELISDKKQFLNKTYPVGSIYVSTSSVNPNSIFGGTWVAYGSGRTIVGVDTNQGEFNTVEKTGGEKTHTLSIAELPRHNHNLSTGTVTTKELKGYIWNVVYQDESTAGGSASGIVKQGIGHLESAMVGGNKWVTDVNEGFTIDATHNHMLNGDTNYSGNNTPHNNLQPYITVNMWKRTA